MGPDSSEFREIGPHAAEVGRLAMQAIKEAAWLDRFDFAKAGDFDFDRFTSRPSRRFTDVLRAQEAVKQASFTDPDALMGLIGVPSEELRKSADARIDGNADLCFNTIDKPIVAVALKYAEYKVAALNAVLSGATTGGASNTNNRETLLALVAAQDL